MVPNQDRFDIAEPPIAHDSVWKRDRVCWKIGSALGQCPYCRVGDQLFLCAFAVADVGIIAICLAVAADGEDVLCGRVGWWDRRIGGK